jgi:replicative DNA helicase
MNKPTPEQVAEVMKRLPAWCPYDVCEWHLMEVEPLRGEIEQIKQEHIQITSKHSFELMDMNQKLDALKAENDQLKKTLCDFLDMGSQHISTMKQMVEVCRVK